MTRTRNALEAFLRLNISIALFGLLGCATVPAPPAPMPPECPGDIISPARGALLPADTSKTLGDYIEMDSACIEGQDGLEIQVLALKMRSSNAELLCADVNENASFVVKSTRSLAEDGQYCVRVFKDRKITGYTLFSLYAGEQTDVVAYASSKGATENEIAELKEWSKDLLMVSEGRERVRVAYPKSQLLYRLVDEKLTQSRLAAQPQSKYHYQSYRDMVSFRFCCDRSSLKDEPVKRINQSALTWLKKTAPKKMRKEKLRVISYASTPGQCRKNESLSKQRAYSVASALRRMGYNNLSVEWCGETGPKGEAIPINETPYWQRVDVILPEELITFRLTSGEDTEGKVLNENTPIRVEQGEKTICKYQAKNRTVDLVIAIDTSGSMADDWQRQISPYLGEEATRLVDEFAEKGIDAQVFVYTLNYNLCGQLRDSEGLMCLALPPDQLPKCNQYEPEESWGTATSWISRKHPWRPGALRAVLPISDELPCEGDSSSSWEEDQDAWLDGTRDARNFGVKVYPFFGTLTGGISSTAIVELMRLMADATGGRYDRLESMGSQPLKKVFNAISKRIEAESLDLSFSCFPLVEETEMRVIVTEKVGSKSVDIEATNKLQKDTGSPASDRIGINCKNRISCKDYIDESPTSVQPANKEKKKASLECGSARKAY